MNISEEKMKIVIENYFREECNINTTIHDAFEKGFRIGVKKAISEQKIGKWNCSDDMYETAVCSLCAFDTEESFGYLRKRFKFCPNCGAKMER